MKPHYEMWFHAYYVLTWDVMTSQQIVTNFLFY